MKTGSIGWPTSYYPVSNYHSENLYKEFKDKGFKSVKLKLEEMSKKSLVLEHITPFVDNLTKVTNYIDSVKEKLAVDPFFKNQVRHSKGITKIGDEIAEIIFDSLDQCSKILNETYCKARNKFNEEDVKVVPISVGNIDTDVRTETNPGEIMEGAKLIECEPVEDSIDNATNG